MNAVQLITLILSVIGKAVDLAQRIIATGQLDSAGIQAALEQADAALTTAAQGLAPTLAKNDGQVDVELARSSTL